MIYIATLLKVESVTRRKSRYDEKGQREEYEETFGSNPEYACVPIEAKDAADAKKQAQAILKGELRGLGWTSYTDPALHGKDIRKLVGVVTEADHVKLRGKGKQPASEDQDAFFARLRKAAKG